VEQGHSQGLVERVNLLQSPVLLSHTLVVAAAVQACHLESLAKVG
jgi:hypothetical protein